MGYCELACSFALPKDCIQQEWALQAQLLSVIDLILLLRLLLQVRAHLKWCNRQSAAAQLP